MLSFPCVDYDMVSVTAGATTRHDIIDTREREHLVLQQKRADKMCLVEMNFCIFQDVEEDP